MSDIDLRLREDVHLLGELLGETIRQQHGEAFLQKIEDIRHSAKADRRGMEPTQLDPGPVGRGRPAAGGAGLQPVPQPGQHRRAVPVDRRRDETSRSLRGAVLPELLARLQRRPQRRCLARQLAKLEIELVLTAHPTEVARRTLIQKYDAIAAQLAARTTAT
jgi:phosphoenolpyruvate carboxylase